MIGENFAREFRVKTYVILGSLFLALAGLLSSLDSSFLWINFALAAFFYAKAYVATPVYSQPKQKFEQTKTKPKPPVFTSSNTANRSKLILLAALFVFGLFFVIVFFAIITSSKTSYDAFYYNERAEEFRMNGEYDSALIYYRQAMNVSAKDPDPAIGYGKTLMAKQDFDSAFFYFDQVMLNDPGNVEASYNKSLLRFEQKSFDQAIAEAHNTLSIDPTFHSADVIIADSYYTMTNYDSAFRYYQIAYDNEVRSPWVCHVLGYLYQNRGDNDQAIALYKEAVSYDSSLTEVYQRLGELVQGEEGDFYRNRAAANR